MTKYGCWRVVLVLWLAVLGVGCAAWGQGAAGPGVIDLNAGRLPITTVSTAWRFHAGNDVRWAEPGFDDGGWKLIEVNKGWDAQGYSEDREQAWFRFRLVVPVKTAGLVIAMPLMRKSYQLFADGRLIGQVGALPPAEASARAGAARVFAIPGAAGDGPRVVVMALRVWQSPQYAAITPNVMGTVTVGAPAEMLGQFARVKAVRLLERSGMDYTYSLIQIVIGAAAFLLFWLTRQRFYLWFALNMVINLISFGTRLASEHYAWGFGATVLLYALADFLSTPTLAMFLKGLLEVRDKRWIWWSIVLAALAEVGPLAVSQGLPVVWADGLYLLFVTASEGLLLWLVVKAILGRMKEAWLFLVPFALSAGLGDIGNLGHFLADLNVNWLGGYIPSDVPIFLEPFPVTWLDVANIVSLFGFLAVLVYRFAKTSMEEQRLSAALRAAHEIQKRLVPGDQSLRDGLRAEVVYLAAEEVGGDFCQMSTRGDGSVLIAIGDVSGKGLQAAMVGALAVGALRSMVEDEGAGPGEVLRRVNEVMMRSDVQGFITCLCLEIREDGWMTMANAGHLAPYVNGVEMDCGAGLPLGIVDEMEYEERSVMLPREARLTLLSDGVVEARSEDGELFGFERTLEVSGLRAEDIAEAAKRFGQQDDITVVTLEWSAPRVREFAGAREMAG